MKEVTNQGTRRAGPPRCVKQNGSTEQETPERQGPNEQEDLTKKEESTTDKLKTTSKNCKNKKPLKNPSVRGKNKEIL